MSILVFAENPCKLLCTDVDDTIIANWGDTVKDGTPCGVGTNNMCIDGICKVRQHNGTYIFKGQ